MKNLFVIIITLLSINFSFGQTQFGIKGGLNLSNLIVNDAEIDDANMKIGATIGGFARIPLLDWLFLQPEVLYTTKGSKYKYGQTTVKANSSYIDIPVLLSLNVFGTPVSIHAGTQFSILTNAKYKYESPIFANETVIDDDKNSFKSWDVGAAAGIGINLEKMQIQLRVIRGFREVEENRTILNQAFTARDTKHVGFQLTAGFIL